VTEHDFLAEGALLGGQDQVRECHRMLLRLAGQAPDGLLTQVREWLARGQLGALARSVTSWAVSQDALLPEADTALLASLLAEVDEADQAGLAELTVDDLDRLPYYAFAQRPGPGAGTAPDEAAVAAAAGEPGVVGVWRAWRFPADGSPWPPARRVFVVEAGSGDEAGVAARVARGLVAAGEVDPQVEVYQSGSELPVYTELARSHGELLWAAAPDPGIQLASIFDDVDGESGPLFRAGHPVLGEGEAVRVAGYLLGGAPVLVTEALMDDVLDGGLADCVPMSFRTDGTWVWNEASAYYAERYRLEPDPALMAHVRANGYVLPEVDGVAVHRARQALQDPQEVADKGQDRI
jgi:hypothetical protein